MNIFNTKLWEISKTHFSDHEIIVKADGSIKPLTFFQQKLWKICNQSPWLSKHLFGVDRKALAQLIRNKGLEGEENFQYLREHGLVTSLPSDKTKIVESIRKIFNELPSQ